MSARLHAMRDRSQQMAAAQPIAPELKPTPIPPPSSEEQGAIISEVREYALNYSRNLPDFICTQVTRRYAAAAPGSKYGGGPDSQPSWQALDTLQIRLSYSADKGKTWSKPAQINPPSLRNNLLNWITVGDAGTPRRVADGWDYPRTPDMMAARLPELIAAGARWISSPLDLALISASTFSR